MAKATDKNDINIFAQRLGDLIKENGYTHENVAQGIGVTRQGVGKWVSGESVPDVLTAAKLAKFFNVSVDYLSGNSNIKTNDKDLQAVCKYTGLSENAIKAIKKYEKDFFSLRFIDDLFETQLKEDGLILALERYCFYKPVEADFIISKYESIRPAGIYDEMTEDDLVRISSSQIVEQVIFSDICDKVKKLKQFCGGYGERYWNMLKEGLDNGKHNPTQK